MLINRTNNPFYQPFKSQLLGMNLVFKHQDLQMFGLKLNRYEAVHRGSKIRLQVGKGWFNLGYTITDSNIHVVYV